MPENTLKEYAEKRDFVKTPEPGPATGFEGERLVFVIHKHAARNLHYDLRFELDGVLVSWACPKGPSLDPAVKRLAVRVEDHPSDYLYFEGIIPEGNYGAGGVIVWDRGSYRHPLAKDGKGVELLRAGLAKGDFKFVLEGEKLRGEFALVKTGKTENSWLLLKKRDGFAGGGDVLSQNRSVITGRTIQELSPGSPQSAVARRKAERLRFAETLEGGLLEAAPEAPLPKDIAPMLATSANEPFDDPEWIFEPKWDGYRAMAILEEGRVELRSRNRLSLNARFGPVAEALKAFPFDGVLDGEIVAVDDGGRPDFGLLQEYGKGSGGHLLYYVFDLLFFEGRDLTGLTLLDRKALLKRILPASPRVRFCDHVAGAGKLFYSVARGKGIEGILAKRASSAYEAGVRSRNWQKIKAARTVEAVIAGFTAPKVTGRLFGSLVLGAFRNGELVCIGHSGGGFDARTMERLFAAMKPLVAERCPFAKIPPTNGPAAWLSPSLVCEISFTGWTREGFLRHPVFVRLREDKDAEDVLLDRDEGGGR